MVDINLNCNQYRLLLTYDQLLGILAVYRYLNLPHPLSMYKLPLLHEIKKINNLALSDTGKVEDWYYDWYFAVNPENDGYYNVNVGNDVYLFDNLEFLQGLLTGAKWNNLDPHTFIINLKQWKKEPRYHIINI